MENNKKLQVCKLNYECECKIGEYCMFYDEEFNINNNKSCSENELRLNDYEEYRKYYYKQIEQLRKIKLSIDNLHAELNKFSKNIFDNRTNEKTSIKENAEIIELIDDDFKDINIIFDSLKNRLHQEIKNYNENIVDVLEI